MTDLERYRDEIDEIDSEIVRLFRKRMKVSEEVAEYKIKPVSRYWIRHVRARRSIR